MSITAQEINKECFSNAFELCFTSLKTPLIDTKRSPNGPEAKWFRSTFESLKTYIWEFYNEDPAHWHQLQTKGTEAKIFYSMFVSLITYIWEFYVGGREENIKILSYSLSGEAAHATKIKRKCTQDKF